MKKIILSLITISFAGLLVSAVAQDAPGGNPGDTNPPAPPPGADNGPDNGGLPPPDMGGEPPGAPGQPQPAEAAPAKMQRPPRTPDRWSFCRDGEDRAGAEITANFMPPDLVIGTNQNDLNFEFPQRAAGDGC